MARLSRPRWPQRLRADSGTVASTYTLALSDGAYMINVVVTATNAGGSGSATSSRTGQVFAPVLPFNTVAPAISGTPTEGQSLTAGTGTWEASPIWEVGIANKSLTTTRAAQLRLLRNF